MTSKAGKLRKRQRAGRLASIPPMVLCTVAGDQIHRDGFKCDTCGHHHCRLCRICARCRRYGNGACRRVNEAAVPLARSDRPRGAPWWRKVKQWKRDQVSHADAAAGDREG